jgi:pimeloyl-ACP methyl ester carboxylesterase
VTSKGDPGVRMVAFENAPAQRIDPNWREPPPPAVDRLGELRAAVLLVVGEEDIAEVGEIADPVAEAVPGSSKRVVAEADQLVNLGEPERFNQLALDFLAFAG